MKILKIVVDELPKRCFDCLLWCENSCDENMTCTPKNEMFTDYHIKQSWCPLEERSKPPVQPKVIPLEKHRYA